MNNGEVKKIISKKVAPMAIALSLAGSTFAFGADAVFAVAPDKDYTTVEQDNEETYTAKSDTYETKEEAENWLDEKKAKVESDYDVVSEGVNEIKNQVVDTKEVTVEEEFDTKEEAETRKTELESKDVKDVELTIKENKKEEEYFEKVEVNEKFETEEEAKEYIESLKDKYNVSVSTDQIYNEWISQGKIKVTEIKGLTEEERDKQVKDIENEIKKDENETTRYEITVTKTSHTEKVFVKDEVTGDTKTFNSLEEAKEYIENLKLEESDTVKILIDGPKDRQEFVETETKELSGKFKTREEAEAYIKELKDNGYVVTDEKITEETTTKKEKVPNGDIIIKDSHKLNKNSTFAVQGNYIFIKQASGNVAIWTEEPLSAEEQQNIKDNWLKGGYDGSISGSFNFYYISGLGVHDLSYIGKQWGEYTIVKNNEFDYTMTCDAANISHMDYGTFEKGYDEKEIITKEYEVSGSAGKDIYKTVYDVTHERTEKIYRDETTYGAEIEKETFTRDIDYNVTGSYDDKKIREEISYILSGKLIENIRGSLWEAYLTVKEKELVPTETEIIPEEEKERNEEVIKSSSPQTGDESNLGLAAGLLVTSAAGAGYVLSRKRKYNK